MIRERRKGKISRLLFVTTDDRCSIFQFSGKAARLIGPRQTPREVMALKYMALRKGSMARPPVLTGR